jgi:hypothetical protein
MLAKYPSVDGIVDDFKQLLCPKNFRKWEEHLSLKHSWPIL